MRGVDLLIRAADELNSYFSMIWPFPAGLQHMRITPFFVKWVKRSIFARNVRACAFLHNFSNAAYCAILAKTDSQNFVQQQEGNQLLEACDKHDNGTLLEMAALFVLEKNT